MLPVFCCPIVLKKCPFSAYNFIAAKRGENISLYLSYSESFLPRSGEQYANINGSNNQLDPDTYSTQEAGIKWDFADGLSFTAAIFENQQSC